MEVNNARPVVVCPQIGEEGAVTKQADADLCDIKKIVARAERGGIIAHLAKGTPFYGDVSELTDYQSCVEKVRVADELFMAMPVAVRKKFENDPAKMIEWLQDSSHVDEAVALGMAVKRPVVPVETGSTGSEGSGAPQG